MRNLTLPSALALAVLAAPVRSAAAPASRPSVEVVFVLDTTSSMGGLIDGAKRRIWSIANEIAKGKPAPRLKMGLVAYRDKGDAYVSRVFDLSANLDKVYEELSALRAEGGGDGPEHVLKGLEDAVERVSWSADTQTFRVLYLVGDAPPHFDYGDTPALADLVGRAVGRGIVVNAVECGSDPETERVWREAARLGEGRFLAIAQEGGMTAAAATPYDERLAELGRRLDGTRLAWGRRKVESEGLLALSRGVAASVSGAMAADRAEAKAAGGFGAEYDLAEAYADKKADLKSLDDKELPDAFRGLSAGEREAKLKRTLAERRALQKELAALSAKRSAHLAAEARKAPKASKDAFDAKLLDSLKEEAAKKGISY